MKSLQEKFDSYITEYFNEDVKGTNIRTELIQKVRESKGEIDNTRNRLNTPQKDVQAAIEKIKANREKTNKK